MAKLTGQPFVTLLLASYLFIGVANSSFGEENLDDLINRVPLLSSGNKELDAISLEYESGIFNADIRWHHDQPISILLTDRTTNSPIGLLASNKLLINDLSEKTVWVRKSVFYCLQFTVDDQGDGGFNLQIGKESEWPSEIDFLTVNINQSFQTNCRTVRKLDNESKYQATFYANGRDARMTAIFDAKEKAVLCQYEFLKDESSQPIIIKNIKINAEAKELFECPSKTAIRSISAYNGDLDFEEIPIEEKKKIEISGLFAAIQQLVNIRKGLYDPDKRDHESIPKYFDWNAVEQYDKEFSPALLKLIQETAQ